MEVPSVSDEQQNDDELPDQEVRDKRLPLSISAREQRAFKLKALEAGVDVNTWARQHLRAAAGLPTIR